MAVHYCTHCGGSLDRWAQEGTRCLDCQLAAADARAARAEALAAPRRCEACGREFIGGQLHARYCSGKCRQKAYRKRLAASRS